MPLDDYTDVEELLREAENAVDPDRAECLRQKAVLLSLALADEVAHRYFGRGLEADDLTQVGRLALVKAVRGYRSGQGHSFPAYAVPTIAGEIKRHFRDCGWCVRPPRRLQELRSQLAETEEALRHSLAGEPSSIDVAHALEVDRESVDEARQCGAGYRPLSLDVPLATGSSLMDFTGCLAPGFDEFDTRDALHRVLMDLSAREQLIVRMRFVEERTQSDIGAVLGVSQMQVSRLLSAIIARLRASLEAAAAA